MKTAVEKRNAPLPAQAQGRETMLGRADWVDAALQCLCEGGVDAIKITVLAERLQVSRGSFYWHFKDRADVLEAILQIWRGKNTANLVKAAETGQGPQDAVLALFECWLDPRLYDPRLDLALRDWARKDMGLKAELRAADAQRLRALAGMYEKAGMGETAAQVAARNLYYMQMGYYALDVQESLAERLAYMAEYYQSYTGQALDPARAAAFIARLGAKEGQA